MERFLLSMSRRFIKRPFRSVEAWMTANGVTQRELAKCLGISESHLCNVLGGKKGVSLRLARSISDLTNVPIETIADLARIA